MVTLIDGGYEGTVNHLLGFLSGISADDTLCDAEIEKLAKLLSKDKHSSMSFVSPSLKTNNKKAS